MRTLLALFPLGQVLLPGAPLPLHIFEPRYRQLLADVCAPGGSRSFGVVALTAGAEVESAGEHPVSAFASVGTVAEIVQVEPGPDDTSDLLAVGSRRFRLLGLAADPAPYLQAEIEYLGEPAGPMPDGLAETAELLAARYTALLAGITGHTRETDYPSDPVALSYRIAADLPLPPDERQQLLTDTTATQRLLHLVVLLRRETVLLQRTRTVAVSAGRLRLPADPN